MINKEFQNFRKTHNMTTKEMAKAIGVSNSLCEKVEYGQRSPSFNFILKFKKRFPEADIDCIFLPQNHTKCVE